MAHAHPIVAAGSFTVTVSPAQNSYSMSLFGTKGGLFQRYRGDALTVADTDCQPNIAGLAMADRPVVQISLTASNMLQQQLIQNIFASKTTWAVNGTDLEFDASGLSVNGDFNGCFQIIDPYDPTQTTYRNPQESLPFGGLRLMRNLVNPSGGTSLNIQCTVYIQEKSGVFPVAAAIPMQFYPINGDSAMANIYPTAGQSLQFTSESDSVELNVQYLTSQTLAPADITKYWVRWMILDGAVWVDATDQAGATVEGPGAKLTVTASMVKSRLAVRADVCDPADHTAILASDIEYVSDASDEYFIEPNTTPADRSISENGDTSQTVVFNPQLFSSRTAGQVQPKVGKKFYYTVAVVTSQGLVLNTYDSGNGTPDNELEHALGTSWTGTYDLFVNLAGHDATVVISVCEH